MGNNFEFLRAANVVGYALLVLVQILTQNGFFGGTNNEISAKYTTLLTPAGFAFTIWVVIFSLEAAWVFYLCIPYGNIAAKKAITEKVGLFVALGWLAQNGWQVTFSQERLGLSLFCIFGAFLSFLAALIRLFSGPSVKLGLGEYLIFAGVSLNAAWLSLASNLSLSILELSVTGQSTVALAQICAVVVVIIGALIAFKQGNFVYPIALVWAFNGVRANQEETSIIFAASTAMAFSALLAISAIIVLLARNGVRGFSMPAEVEEISYLPLVSPQKVTFLSEKMHA